MAADRIARFGTLLRVRKRQEDLKAQALAIARTEHAALRRQRRELDERRRALMKEADVRPGAAFEPTRVEAIYQYERHLGRRSDAKDAEIALHGRTVQAARTELESAMAQKRIMEKLIERAEKAERAEAVRREQRWHDESSVIRFAHGRRRGGEGP
jgi:flagellar export protein FliJ